MINCIYSREAKCLIASRVAGVSIPIPAGACEKCSICERPQALNTVTLSLAFAATRRPDILQLLRKAHETLFNKPGSALRSIFQELGISEGENCQCDEYAALMDSWGTEGCRQRIPEIVAHLNAQSISWYDMAKVALGGYLTTKSLVEDAIKCSSVRS